MLCCLNEGVICIYVFRPDEISPAKCNRVAEKVRAFVLLVTVINGYFLLMHDVTLIMLTYSMEQSPS